METERIALSQRERDRLKVLHEIQQKHLTQIAGAQRLKISDRQVRRMLLRLRQRGDPSLVHGLRGRPSNRKLPARLEHKIVARLQQRYADFGPTLAAEHLAQEGFSVSRETLRKWMSKAGLWSPRSQRVKAVHVWRERRASFGELVMQDSSPFHWLEERGPACQLIALIDDATSRIWGRFTEHDTTEENLRTFGGWVQRYGRPLAHYTDKNSIFRTSDPAQLREQLRGDGAVAARGVPAAAGRVAPADVHGPGDPAQAGEKRAVEGGVEGDLRVDVDARGRKPRPVVRVAQRPVVGRVQLDVVAAERDQPVDDRPLEVADLGQVLLGRVVDARGVLGGPVPPVVARRRHRVLGPGPRVAGQERVLVGHVAGPRRGGTRLGVSGQRRGS